MSAAASGAVSVAVRLAAACTALARALRHAMERVKHFQQFGHARRAAMAAVTDAVVDARTRPGRDGVVRAAL